MDGILEQILSELKEIKHLLSENITYDASAKGQSFNDTMKFKEAAEYLGIAQHRLRVITNKGKIKHFKAGNKFLYKRKSLDCWLEEVQEASLSKDEEITDYGRIRQIKE